MHIIPNLIPIVPVDKAGDYFSLFPLSENVGFSSVFAHFDDVFLQVIHIIPKIIHISPVYYRWLFKKNKLCYTSRNKLIYGLWRFFYVPSFIAEPAQH